MKNIEVEETLKIEWSHHPLYYFSRALMPRKRDSKSLE